MGIIGCLSPLETFIYLMQQFGTKAVELLNLFCTVTTKYVYIHSTSTKTKKIHDRVITRKQLISFSLVLLVSFLHTILYIHLHMYTYDLLDIECDREHIIFPQIVSSLNVAFCQCIHFTAVF